MLYVFEIIQEVWIQLHVLRKRGFQTPWINLKYTNLSRSVCEILCSVSPHIVSGFFSFVIQIHRRITCNKFSHVPDCSCPVSWPDFSPGGWSSKLQCIDLWRRSLWCHTRIYWCNDILWNHLKSLETNFCGLWTLDILWGSCLIKNADGDENLMETAH